MQTQFVKPAPGKLIRQPDRAFAPLPAEGALVPLSPYWKRRLNSGDVINTEPPKPRRAIAPVAEKPNDGVK